MDKSIIGFQYENKSGELRGLYSENNKIKSFVVSQHVPADEGKRLVSLSPEAADGEYKKRSKRKNFGVAEKTKRK